MLLFVPEKKMMPFQVGLDILQDQKLELHILILIIMEKEKKKCFSWLFAYKKILTMRIVVIRIKSIFNKNPNEYYYKTFVQFNYLKNNNNKFFDSMIMLKSGKTEEAKEEFYGAKKETKNWDVNVDIIVISKVTETKNISKYLIEYLDDVIRPLVLILPKIRGYV